MRWIAAAVLACSLAVTAGCSTRPVVVATQPLWPFEELEIRTSIGHVRAYLSRPPGSIERLVVTAQRSPCTNAATPDASREIVGTSGLFWRQFKDDSLFLQFEKPGATAQSVSPCERASGDVDADLLRIVVDSVRALRRQEQIDALPTFYIGVGMGAAAAFEAATRDADAKFIALVSAMLDADTMALGELEHRARSRRLSVAILHAADDRRTPLSQARQLLGALTAADVPTSMLIFEGAGFDFGLHSGRSDCLEIVADALGERMRSPQATTPRTATVSCSPAAAADEPSELQIEQVERLDPQ